MQNKQKKMFTAIAAGAMAVVMALTGTFAWQSISQRATNEVVSSINPGARLHDDFSGTNKDVYVENFTDPDENGADIFVRIRLDEYMEIGEGAGLKEGDEGYDDKKAVSLVAENADGTVPDINKPETWTTHIPSASNTAESLNSVTNPFHTYYSWDMAGQTVYMPTFNMNKDSLEADINGTLEGEGGVPYGDYEEYDDGETKNGYEIWDADDNGDDELEDLVDINDVIGMDDTAVTTVDGMTTNVTLEKGTVDADNDGKMDGVEHTAKATLDSSVITMAEWKAMGSPVGQYWVYDVDGWAYWADAVAPGTATGLLLDGISMRREADGDAYYAIHVVAQFATRGDWGEDDGTGFYNETEGVPPTADALALLNKAANLVPTATGVSIDQGYKTYATVDNALNLTASVRVENATGAAEETAVTWSIEPAAVSFSDGTFIPTAAEADKTFRITATSVLDPTKSSYTDVYVAPADSLGVVTGANGNSYVKYADNTYRLIGSDGTVSAAYTSAGADMTIGNTDDKPVVLLADMATTDTSYGTKFIGPNTDESYYAAGDDSLLGVDDVKVWIDDDTGNLTASNPALEAKVDTVTVTAADNATTVKSDAELQFTAKVTKDNTEVNDEYKGVTWTVIGGSTGTTISESGLLKVSATEASGTVLTIRATSTVVNTVIGEWTVTVQNLPAELEAIKSITPGSTATVTIDGIEWYVLAKEGDSKALLLSKDILETRAFDTSDNRWSTSAMRTYLNGEWLTGKTVLSQYAAETELNTIQEYNSNDVDTTKDRVFLLSEADVFGSSANATLDDSHYTISGTKLTAPGGSWIAQYNGSAKWYWLRSPRRDSTRVAVVDNSGDLGYTTLFPTPSGGVRPALWVDLGS